MALYRKQGSKIYYCKFDFKGKEIRRSTGATNKKDALKVKSRIHSELVLGRWGILESKPDITLKEFLEKHFVMGEIKPKTAEYYAYGVSKLLDSELAKLLLNRITKQDAQRYVAKHVRPASDFDSESRQSHLENEKFSPSSVNCVLRTLRRALSVARESGYLSTVQKIELAKNERHRELVISEAEQQAYFLVVQQPCGDVALLMVRKGLRPDELHRLDWRDIELSPNGMIHILSGKTRNAKRDLPLDSETYQVLLRRFEEQGRPREGWVFPAPTKSGHIEESSIRKQHIKAIKDAKLDHFELYCFRHTFLTILGASGCDPYTLCRIAGHSDIKMGMRYCHTQNEYVVNAFLKMGEFRQNRVTTGGYRSNFEGNSQPLSQAATNSNQAR